MPPRIKATREEIIDAALALVREKGAAALNARALAARLGVSTQPIFSNFASMEALWGAVLEAAYALYRRRMEQEMATGRYPAFKASGMAYIRFAREEGELFRLLFMRDRSGEPPRPEGEEDMARLVALLQRATGLDRPRAERLYVESWVYSHGVAAMVATGYLAWEPETVSAMLSDVYWGLVERLRKEQEDERDTNGETDQAL